MVLANINIGALCAGDHSKDLSPTYCRLHAQGSRTPSGSLAMNDQDTLYRIHGTNQPEYIGHAISSGCIRMTNEDVIDLVDRVKPGAIVVVLPPGRSAS